MQVLLINQNATIERLVKLSSGKLGYELTNAKDISEVENGAYGFVVMDSDLYNDEEFGILKQKFGNAKYILIITKGAERPEGFDVYIEKPFLPTELVDIFGSLAASVENTIDEEAVFGDEEAVFEDEELQQDLPSVESVFDTEEQSGDIEELGDLDDFDSLGLEEEKAEEPSELEDLEFSFDDDAPLDIESKEDNMIETATEDDKLDDSFEINLDEQMSAINDEVEGIDFDMPEDISLDETSDEISMPEIAAEDSNDFAGLDELSVNENDIEMELDDILPTEEALMPENEADEEELSIGDDMGDFDEELGDEMPNIESDPHIFDEDEVNKLKNLLDETEEDKQDDDDLNLDNIKIHNEELGSLTEESLAEALGVSIDSQAQHSNDSGSDIEEGGIDESGIPDSLPAAPSAVAPTNFGLNALELNPNQSITISLDALKELLNMADVTINITLSKKQ